MNKKKRTFLKSAVIGITAIATSLTLGVSAACANSGGGSTNDEDDKTTTKIDEQTIKNGNFEFYSDNKGLYPVSNPDNWSRGSSGDTSSSLSGVIDTGKEHWDYITDPELPQILEDNDDLESGDNNKKDYNGALADDLPYKNTHAATDDTNKDEDAKDYIENPFTHSYRYDEESGKVLNLNGEEVTTYTDDDGNVFLDEELKQPLETSVLMIHNYRRNNYHGTETYFTNATTVSLEANTAAEISLWVKTSELYFSGADTTRKKVDFDRGAYIKVNTSVGGNSLDAFEIKNINTEKLVETPFKTVDEKEVIDYENWENNGWVQYTVYVAASSFATTTVNVTLGLGEDESNTVEGYAFFDDVTVKKYLSVDDMESKTEFRSKIHEPSSDSDPETNVSYPLSTDAKNEFRVDTERYKTNDPVNGGITDKVYDNNFADRHFFIDFASYKGNTPVPLSSDNVKAGLTVEDTNTGKFVCSTYSENNKYKTNLDVDLADYAGVYIPSALRDKEIKIGDDILATTTVGSDEGWTFGNQLSSSGISTEYDTVLTNALKTAPKLPGANGNADALVMLSAYGAAYEAHITDSSFALAGDKYMLVSFWIKTSDMNGSTAATVTVKGLNGDDKDVSSSFTVDSTTLSKVTIGEGDDEIEDVYNGWARCFVRVSNTSEDKDSAKPFEIVVNFGNTSIRDTAKSAYNYGWVALTNISVMELDEDVYGYTSGSAQTASIEFTETAEKPSNNFDTEQGEKNEIKNDLANPSSYEGVNGASQRIEPNDNKITIDGYHDTNKNAYAGILNKDNFENYASNNCMWYNVLQAIEQDNLAAHDNNLWNAVFGERTVQPLLIVNTLRSIGQSDTPARYNYGYIGNSASVSSNGYQAVSVRVKASAGAVANVYLVEDKASGSEVLSYSTPKYNFWYDADGNILKSEPAKNETLAQQKENIAYRLRKDGLYTLENDESGALYANFYNLTRLYDESFEHETFYDEEGNLLVFKKGETIKDDEIYYANAEKTAYAPHYLIAGGKENNKVYLYSGEGLGDEATYYYVEDGKANRGKLVHAVDTSVAALRYATKESGVISSPYQFTIDTVEHPEYAGKWITVTFFIHAGSETKNYRLELWSGARDEQSSYTESGYAKDSYVVFDYSNFGASLNQTTYDGLVDGYTADIISEYKKVITDKLDDSESNISDLEKIAADKNLNVDRLYDYEAAYYTFSLYDSQAFIPFNGEINTDNTGYDFDYTQSEESLAYLKVVDDNLSYGSTDEAETFNMSMFIDYSIIDKDIEIIGEPTAPGAGDNGNETPQTGDTVNVWLLASSIALVVAIFLAIAAIFIRDFVKKRKGKKTSGKNSYNFNKNKRYVKKYVKANGEAPAIEEGEFDKSLMSDKSAETEESVEETPSEEATAETTETVEEAPAVEEQPAEDVNDSPAESEKPEDDGKEE